MATLLLHSGPCTLTRQFVAALCRVFQVLEDPDYVPKIGERGRGGGVGIVMVLPSPELERNLLQVCGGDTRCWDACVVTTVVAIPCLVYI